MSLFDTPVDYTPPKEIEPTAETQPGFTEQPVKQASTEYVPQQADKPAASFDPSAASAEPAQDMLSHLSDVYQTGQEQAMQSLAMYEALAGRKTYEDVQQNFKPGRVQELRNQRISQFNTDVSPDVTGKFYSNWLPNALDFAIGASPQLLDTVNVGLGSADVGALTGAAVGTPAGPAGSLAGAASGAGLGFTAGFTSSAAMMVMGEQYKRLRDNGVSHDNAVPWAVAGGAVETMIFQLRTKSLAHFGMNAADGIYRSTLGKSATVQAVARMMHDLQIGYSQGWLQEATAQLTDYAAAVTGHGAKIPTLEESLKKAHDAAMANMKLAGLTHGTGYSAGAILHAITKINAAHQGTVIKQGVKVEVAAAEYEAQKATEDYEAAKGAHDAMTGTIEAMKVEGKVIPRTVWDAYNEAGNEVGKRQKAAADAVETRKALTEFNTLEPDEQLKIAKENLHQADNQLEIVRYEIEVFEDNNPDSNLSSDLLSKRKNAVREKRIASDVVRRLELAAEKEALEDRLTDPEAGEGIKLSARSAINKIDTEVKKITSQEAKRKIAARIAETKTELTNVQDQLDFRNTGKHTPGLAAQIETTRPTERLNKAKDRLVSDIETLETIHDLVDGDLMSLSELEKLNAKIPSGRVGKLHRLATKQVERVSRETAREAVGDASKEQKAAERIIAKSGLSKKDQAKLPPFIVGTDLNKWLEKTEKRIADLTDKAEMRKADEHLDDALEAAAPKEVAGRLNGLPDVQKLLNELREAATAESDTLSAEQKNNIADRMLDLSDAGKAKKALNRAMVDAQLESGVGNVRESMPDGKHTSAFHKVIKVAQTEEERSYELKNKVEQHFRAGDTDLMTWDNFVDMLLQFADRDSDAAKWLSVHESVDAKEAGIMKWQDELVDSLINNSKGKKDEKLAATLVQSAVSKRRKEFAGRTDLFDVPDLERMQWLARMDDPFLHDRITKGNKLTLRGEAESFGVGESDQAKLERALSPEQLKMVEKVKQFYRKLYDSANAHHEKIYGYALGDNPNYSGPGYAKDFNPDNRTSNDFVKEVFTHRSIVPGFTKVATQSEVSLRGISILDNINGYIQDLEHWKAFTEERHGLPGTAKRLEAFFGDADAMSAADRLFGHSNMTKMRQAYEDIVGLKPVLIKQSGMLGEAVRGAGKSVQNIAQLWKQPSGFWLYLRWMDPITLYKNAWEVATNFEAYAKIFENSNMIKSREVAKSSKLIKDRIQAAKTFGGDNPVKAGLRLLQDLQGLPLKLTDAANIYFGSGALYIEEMRKLGATHEDALELAERAARSTQSSSAVDQRTPLSREHPLLTMFSTPNVQAHGLSAGDMRAFLSNPTWENGRKAAASAVAVRAAEIAFTGASAASAVVAAAMQAKDGDDKKLNEALHNMAAAEFVALIFASGANLPSVPRIVLGLILRAASNQVFHATSQLYEPNIPALEAVWALGELSANSFMLASGAKENTPELRFEMWREANKSVIAAKTGLNLEETRKLFQFAFNLSEDPEDRKQRHREAAQAHKEHKQNE